MNQAGTYNVIIRVTDSESEYTEWSEEFVVADLAIEDKLELAKQEGVDDVNNNPADYGLVTQADKEAAVNEATNLGYVNGIQYVHDNLADYGLSTINEMEAAILAAEDLSKQYVIDNPEEFGLINVASVQDVTYETISNLVVGSHLIGSSTEIADLSIFDSAVVIWTFQNGKYKAYTSSADLKEKIVGAGYELVERIAASAGIWVIKE